MQKHLCISVLVLLAFAIPVVAKTPDGQPPSQETVCDFLHGAAFGQCNAYCEAMDCDNPAHRASDQACANKRERLIELTGAPPPCEVTCPCPGMLPLFASFVNGTEPIQECIITPTSVSVGAMDSEFSIVVNAVEGFCSDNGLPPLVPLTADEAQVCRLLLRDTAAGQGVDCVSPE